MEKQLLEQFRLQCKEANATSKGEMKNKREKKCLTIMSFLCKAGLNRDQLFDIMELNGM